MKNIFLALAAVSTLAVSCEKEESSNVNQTRIWTGYQLAYNGEEGKTYAQAQFKFGFSTGTLLKLSAPATVALGADSLSYLPLFPYYEKVYAGQRDSAAFTYRDSTGTVFTSTVSLARTIGFPTDLDTISKSQAYNLAWTGAALSATEDMGVSITSTNGSNYQLFLQLADGANNIVLDTDKLVNLNTGLATIRMERQNYTTPASMPDAGGLAIGKYAPQPKQVVIVP